MAQEIKVSAVFEYLGAMKSIGEFSSFTEKEIQKVQDFIVKSAKRQAQEQAKAIKEGSTMQRQVLVAQIEEESKLHAKASKERQQQAELEAKAIIDQVKKRAAEEQRIQKEYDRMSEQSAKKRQQEAELEAKVTMKAIEERGKAAERQARQEEQAAQKRANALKRLGEEYAKVSTEEAKQYATSLPAMQKYIQAQDGMQNAAVKASGTIRNAAGTFQTYTATVKTADGTLQTYKYAVDATGQSIYRLDQGQRTASAGMKMFSNAAQTAVSQLKMIIGYAGAAQVFRSALTEMKAMSDELVTYQKVTGATAAQMQQVRASAYQSAKQYGQAPSDYLESVARMARAGYGQQAEAMANLATKTQLVGDMSAEMASKFLIAVDAGYRLNGNIQELEKVLNAANVADNNYATSLAQIAEGMTLIAPLAASMNVSVEETTAAIGTMQALTQRSGTEVARAFRMIAINIAKDTETEVEEGFKLTQENIEDFNALLQEFAKEELKAAEASGKLLSPMKAIEAIAKAWKSGKLSEQQLFTVLNNIGGARYTNNIMALVKNFDVYQEMLGKFSTELTSADDEVAAMMDSWSRKLEVLKTSWVEMVNNRVSEDFIKSLLDMGTGFLQWTGSLENFISVAGGAVLSIKALGAGLKSLSAGTGFGAGNALGLAVAGFVALTGAIRSFNEQAANQRQNRYQQSIEHASKTAKEAYDQAKEINDIIAEYNKLTADGVIDSSELEQASSLQDRLNTLVADTGESYDIVNTKIETMKGLLADVLTTQETISLEAAKQARQEAEGAIVRKANDTKKGIFGKTGGLNVALGLENADVASVVAIAKYLRENGGSIATLNENRPGAFGVWEYLAGIPTGKYSLAQGGDLVKTMFGGDYSASIGPTGSISSADEVVEYVSVLKGIMDVLREASKDGGALPEAYWSLKEVVDAFDPFISVLDDTRAREDAVKKKQYDLNNNDGSGSGSGSNAGAEENGQRTDYSIYENDAYAKSYDRLKAAIDAATTAQEKFNAETSTKKSDQLKFYGSALEAYNEELKAGRVNSNAFHAAAKALMGEEAYNATGGYTQNVQAAMNQTGSAGISLIDAITTLTAEYKNQAGEVREGAGLAVLLEKMGYNVRDAQGNYVVKMTEEMYKEVIAAIPGMTREMLENAANAYDQYDVEGRNTNLAPREKTQEEIDRELRQDTNKQLEDTNKQIGDLNTGLEDAGDKAESAADTVEDAADKIDGAADKVVAAVDGNSGNEPSPIEKLQQSADKDTGRDKELAKLAAENREARRLASTATGVQREHADAVQAKAQTQELLEAQRLDREAAMAHLEKLNIQNVKDSGFVLGGNSKKEYGDVVDAVTSADKSVQELQSTIEEGQSEDKGAKTNWGPTASGTQRQHADAMQTQAQTQELLEAQRRDQEAALSAQMDAAAAQDKRDKTLQEISEIVPEIVSYVQEITKEIAPQSAAEKHMAFERNMAMGDTVAAFGGNKEMAARFEQAAAKKDKAGVKDIIAEYFADDIEIGANVSWQNNEAEFNDVVIEIETVLDNYSAAEVAASLEHLTAEQREAVIEAMLNKFSLAEVMAAIEFATGDAKVQLIKAVVERYSLAEVMALFDTLTEEDRVLMLKAMIDKHGEEAVGKFIASLPPEERKTKLDAAVAAKAYGTINAYLNALPMKERITELKALAAKGAYDAIAAYVKSLPPSERTTLLKAMKAAGMDAEIKKIMDSLPPLTRLITMKAMVASGNKQIVEDYKKTLPSNTVWTTIKTAVDYVSLAATVQSIQASISNFRATVSTGISNVAQTLIPGSTKSSGTKSSTTTKSTTKTPKASTSGGNSYVYATGTDWHAGGLARVNDGTGAELIVDSSGPHIAAGGHDAIIDLEKGAKVYTAEQTRQLVGSVPHYAVGNGSLSNKFNYAYDAGSGGSRKVTVDPARVNQLVNELNNVFATFDATRTNDTSYTQTGGKSGTNKSTGKISTSKDSSGTEKTVEDERWDTLRSLIEYILKRLGKALDEQERIIDRQIQELQERRQQSEQQNRLEELQKAVTKAQSDLIEAQSERTVRYLDDNGQWHWMADERKVKQAKEQLQKSHESLQDYLNDLVIDAQIQALENEKTRLRDEYQGYTDLWSDILDAVDTPKGDLVDLIKSLTAAGTGAQKNGAQAVQSLLVKAMQGGSYKKNYTEAIGEIAKATKDNPSVPGISDAALAAMIASSGTNISRSAMTDALQSIAGGGTLAGGKASQNTTTHQDTYYMINGVNIGADMAELPMSEVLRRLSVFNNTLR